MRSRALNTPSTTSIPDNRRITIRLLRVTARVYEKMGLGEHTSQHSEPNAVVPHECDRSCSFASQDAGSRRTTSSFIRTIVPTVVRGISPTLIFFRIPAHYGRLLRSRVSSLASSGPYFHLDDL